MVTLHLHRDIDTRYCNTNNYEHTIIGREGVLKNHYLLYVKLKTSIADPDPGSKVFFPSGSGSGISFS